MKVIVFGRRGSWDLVVEVRSISEAKLQGDVKKRISATLSRSFAREWKTM